MKTVVITGGDGDIAKAIKSELDKRGGYQVHCPGREHLDVTNIESIGNYFSEISTDILINNAGYIIPAEISENKYNSDLLSIGVNLSGCFLTTGKVIENNKDAIVINIGSSAGTNSRGGWSSYCAAKAGLIMATECWADEGIRTICISPGRTDTKMRHELFPGEDKSGLLGTESFAKVVCQAIEGRFEWGGNVGVSISNIGEFE